MKRWIGLVFLAAAAAVLWFALKPAAPPEVPFARARRERIESILSTNGKTEPVQWAPITVQTAGRLKQVLVERGSSVRAGTPVAVFESGETEAGLAAAESRLAQARSGLSAAESGGSAAELAVIDTSLARLRAERDAARRDVESLSRLAAKQAATAAELNAVRDRLALLEAQIEGETARRKALVSPSELQALRASLRDAQAALDAARARIEALTVRSPRDGVIYEVPLRAGDWAAPGAILAKVGQLDRLRVVIFVDEPDLGRVRKGMSVLVTWDAMPGRQWAAEVMETPVSVVSLGTRQVGEVVTVAANPQRDLPPGANINASILSQVVDGALAIPKAALRREEGSLGVFLLAGSNLEWRTVDIGVSSATTAQIRSGLKEGDLVAMPSDTPLRSGMQVRALLR
jgi:HlyD family secretion protein